MAAHSFHLILADGSERDVKGAAQTVEANGALVVRNNDGEALVVYASGAWTLAERERKDDKG
jgi:hypothetical protein